MENKMFCFQPGDRRLQGLHNLRHLRKKPEWRR